MDPTLAKNKDPVSHSGIVVLVPLLVKQDFMQFSGVVASFSFSACRTARGGEVAGMILCNMFIFIKHKKWHFKGERRFKSLYSHWVLFH